MPDNPISLREYVEKQFISQRELMDERDRLYMNNFKASEMAVSVALAGAEKLVSASFAASEKAVLKAEQAQKEYNERSNEFRGQLDDQAKMLMPRTETDSRFQSVEDRITTMQKSIDEQIRTLRSSRDEWSGRDSAVQNDRTQHNWSTGIVIGVIVSVISIVLHFIK